MKTHYLMAGVAALLVASAAQAQTPVPVPTPVAAPAATAAPVRPAGSPAVLSPLVVYDREALIAGSLAGQDMINKLKAIREQIKKNELDPDQRQLESELNAILAGTVQESQSPAGRQRQEAFERLSNDFQQKQGRLGQVLQATNQNALENFEKALGPVLKDTLIARNGLIAITSDQVVAYNPGVDITADLITRLNAATKTINVVRATLQSQAGPATPAVGGAPAAAPGGAPLPARPPAAVPKPK